MMHRRCIARRASVAQASWWKSIGADEGAQCALVAARSSELLALARSRVAHNLQVFWWSGRSSKSIARSPSFARRRDATWRNVTQRRVADGQSTSADAADPRSKKGAGWCPCVLDVDRATGWKTRRYMDCRERLLARTKGVWNIYILYQSLINDVIDCIVFYDFKVNNDQMYSVPVQILKCDWKRGKLFLSFSFM